MASTSKCLYNVTSAGGACYPVPDADGAAANGCQRGWSVVVVVVVVWFFFKKRICLFFIFKRLL